VHSQSQSARWLRCPWSDVPVDVVCLHVMQFDAGFERSVLETIVVVQVIGMELSVSPMKVAKVWQFSIIVNC